jgi:Na+-transporting NADH:ubiquinone oxidoreductase subunit C
MANKDTMVGTLTVAGILCILCSIVVSAAAVLLADKQDENKLVDKRKNILVAAGMYQKGDNVNEKFANIETRLVDFSTGQYVEASSVAEGYDQKKAAKDPKSSEAIPAKQDFAGIKSRAKIGYVYLVKSQDKVEKIILPIHGKGLWSTMYGFIALNSNIKEIDGITFYEHGETPGLGGEIENPKWQAQWVGKLAFNDAWEPAIKVIKGKVDTSLDSAKYEIDGLSGATITSRGVSDTMRYWLSGHAYGKYLENLRQGRM